MNCNSKGKTKPDVEGLYLTTLWNHGRFKKISLAAVWRMRVGKAVRLVRWQVK